jgi:heptosyltransferase-1
MRVLVVKTSSLGDVIHTLPALTDACRHIPHIQFDWVVEEAFNEIPRWHPAVDTVIPVAIRRWRKNLWHSWRCGEWRAFRRHLRQRYYDRVIDAQGLLKSAFLTWQAHGLRCGLDADSAREPLAARFYQQKFAIPQGQHAITRVRQLFAAALDYPCPQDMPEYGLNRYAVTMLASGLPNLIFLHGTTWPSKHWPEPYWHDLALKAAQTGYRVQLPWGNEAEHERAQRIAAQHANIRVMPASSLGSMAAEISQAAAVVGVDTGLMHLAAALSVPGITLYGSTDAGLTGTLGKYQQHLQAEFACAPCFRRDCNYVGAAPVTPACYGQTPPALVWKTLQNLIKRK